MSEESLEARVRAVDEDRWLATRFASADARPGLVAVLAFNHEIARVAEIVSEPMLGEIRLQWWRETLTEIGNGGAVRAHDVAQALATDLSAEAFARARPHLDALIDARARDLDPSPFPDLAALSGYAAATAGGVTAASLAALDAQAAPDGLAFAAGEAWGLTGLMRAFAARAAAGRSVLPEALCRAEGLRPADVAAGRAPEAVRAVLDTIGEAAQRAYAQARKAAKGAPAGLWPAYGYVALCSGYLRRLSAPARDPYRDGAERGLLGRQTALLLAALRGGL